MSENLFQLKRDAAGVKMFIKSATVEQFFINLANGRTQRLQDSVTRYDAHFNDNYNYRQLTDNLCGSQSSDRSVAKPTFNDLGQFVYTNGYNLVGVTFLMVKGLTDGKTFTFQGLFSNEKMKQIGECYKRTMEYIINEAQKPCIVRFSITESPETAHVEEILYPAPVIVGE